MAQVAVMSPDGSVKKIDRDSQEGLEALRKLSALMLKAALKQELLNNKEIQKMMKKQKKILKIHKIADFFEMVVEYGFWKVITGKVKREYFDLEGVSNE